MNESLKPIVLALSAILVACTSSEPDQVVTFKSPTDGVFYTAETHYGHGAIDSDYTRVYLHAERSGKSVRELVLSGNYVTVRKVEWASPEENTIIFEGGITDTFRNRVTISLDGESKTFHASLQEVRPPSLDAGQQAR